MKLERTRAIVIRDVKTQVENEKIDLSSIVDMDELSPLPGPPGGWQL